MSKLAELKRQICSRSEFLLRSGLITLSGGNISARYMQKMLITPRYSAEIYEWKLKPSDICEISLEEPLIEIPQNASRESHLHYIILKEFNQVNALIHTHERNLLTFAQLRKPLPLFGESATLLGEKVSLCGLAPSGSTKLANVVLKALSKNFSYNCKQLAILIPSHGALIGAERLSLACSLLAALSECAYAKLMTKQIV